MTGAADTRDRVLAHLRARAEWYWAPLLYAAVVAVLYRQIWSGRIGFGWDTIEQCWADLSYLSNQLARGHWPLWNPFGRGGYPFHADPESPMYSPLQWLFAGAGVALGGVSWWLIQIRMLLNHVIAGATMHLYLRTRGLKRLPAMIGAIAWIVCAPMMIHKASPVIAPVVWTPLLWVAIDRVVSQPSWRRGCALAAAIYLAGTAGSPPGFFYALLLAVPYGLFRVGEQLAARKRKGGGGELKPWAGELAIAIAIAAAVTVAMLLIAVVPALQLTAHSPRAHRTLGYALGDGVPVAGGLMAMLQPSVGSLQVTFGVVVAMLAACGLVVRPGRDRGAPVYFAAASAFYLCLAFGGGFPLLKLCVLHLPGFGLFRVANRYKLLLAVTFPALAAFGAAAVVEAVRARPRWAAIAGAVVVAGAAAAIVLSHHHVVRRRALPGWEPLLFCAAGAALIAAAALSRGRAAAAALAAVGILVAFEVPHFRSVHGPVMERRPPDRTAILRRLPGVRTRWRVWDEFYLEQRPGSRLDIREMRGYPAGDPLELVRYKQLRRFVRRRPGILADYNVRYILHGPHHRDGYRENDIKAPPDHVAPRAYRHVSGPLYQAIDPAPLVAWYGVVHVEHNPRRVLEDVADAHTGEGPRRYAVVEPTAAAKIPASVLRARPQDLDRLSVAGRLEHYAPDSVRVHVDAPAPGLVVLNEFNYPGWTVAVDGHEAKPVTANYLLRAVAVDAGSHDIVWRYRPPHYRALVIAWALGALALLAAAAPPLRRRRRPTA